MGAIDYALSRLLFFFFFQAEDGIRDRTVTGVQTCALPISFDPGSASRWRRHEVAFGATSLSATACVVRTDLSDAELAAALYDGLARREHWEIGRASCRERV